MTRRTGHSEPSRIGSSFNLLLLIAAFWPASVAADPPNAHRHPGAADRQVMVRAAAADVPAVAAQYGLTVVGGLSHVEGHFAVVEGPETMTAEQIEGLIQGDPRIQEIDRIDLATIPGTAEAGLQPAMSDVAIDRLKTGTFSTSCLSQEIPDHLWTGFANQEAAALIRLHEGHLARSDCGSTTVAVIDTGIDPTHPVLVDALLPGYDFLLERSGIPSEWDFLDQSLQPILDQSLQPILDQSLQPILDQSLQPILDAVRSGNAEVVSLGSSIAVLLDQQTAPVVAGLELPPFFGHGTMVAGVVRLSAPGAQIMPLRVFNASGHAHPFDIIRAIYYAVDHGADVINMSFSMPESSTELQRAVQYARSQGVVCVAAAGNHGEHAQVFPAKYSAAVGVAATTIDDDLSDFSNYGSNLVDLGAPGAAIVSTYPGGVFAAGWGTSFSAPFVAGAAALVHDPGGDAAAFQSTVQALSQGSVQIPALAGDIGSGRLDALDTVLRAD
ncbi:MAG: S8 family serine peptidase [Acidobacteriota bacterium]